MTDLDKRIKLIASTAEEFAALSDFRASLPDKCKEQIEQIESFMGGHKVIYKSFFDRPVLIQGHMYHIGLGEGCITLQGEKIVIEIPRSPVGLTLRFI